MNELENSVTFDLYRKLTNSRPATINLYHQIVSILDRKRAWTFAEQIRAEHTLEVLLANLLPQCFRLNSKYLAIPLNSNAYRPSIYKPNNITHKILRGLVEGLERLDYISVNKGFYDNKTGIGRNTRLSITEKFREFVASYNFGIENIRLDFSSRPLIILKDNKRNMINYEVSESVENMANSLRVFNERIRSSDIKLVLNEEQTEAFIQRMSNTDEPRCLDFSRRLLYRVFNNSTFDQGGRLYGGWWQQIPKDYREDITIDERPTIEIDYSECHPRLLYHTTGIETPGGDCYVIEGYGEEYRESAKTLFNIMLNSVDRLKALKANRNKIALPEGKSIEDLEQAIRMKHLAIAERFYSGAGLELMYHDSIIANDIMLQLAERDITCLPIHDSFIVQSQYADQLTAVMRKAYHRQTGYKAKIKGVGDRTNAANMVRYLRDRSPSINTTTSVTTD